MKKAKELFTARPIEPTRIYDRREAGVVTNTSYKTIIRASESGELRGYRPGRRVVHSGEQLLEWLKSKEE